MLYWDIREHESAPEYVWACLSGAGNSNRAALRVATRENHPHQPEVLVLHQRGAKYWGGRGMGREYAPAVYIVLRSAGDGLYEEIVRFPVRGKVS